VTVISIHPDRDGPHSYAESAKNRGTGPGTISRSEIKFLVFFTVLLCVVTSLPYALGHLVSFPGTVFTDVLHHSVDTGNYFAYANQAASGKWLFRNPMTPEPHRAVFFNLEWLATGKLSSWLHVSLALAMNILRLLCLGLMCYGVYWLSTFLLLDPLMRRIALVGTMAGGGFGWLATLHLLHIPINSSYFLDLTNPNFFPFYWALKVPHFLVSESFVVLGFCFFLLAERDRRARYYVGAGLCYLVAGGCRPYDMLFAMAATALYLAIQYWEDSGSCSDIILRAVPILMCMPFLAYNYWIFKIHPIFRWWSLPGGTAPAVWMTALSFGLTFLLLPFALWRLRRRQLGQAGRFMICCLASAIVFTHLHFLFHFAFQFATNLLTPAVMVVLLGLEGPITKWREERRWASGCIVVLLLVNSATSIALTGQAVQLVARGDFRADSQLLQAFAWLNANSLPNEVVLANFETSNQLPQYAHNIVFCGYVNAVRFGDKFREQQEFLNQATSNEFRAQMIRQNAIQFVMLTAGEAHDLVSLRQAPFLREVFRNRTAVVFRVTTPQPASASPLNNRTVAPQ
jgi:hypothetical protein